MLILDGTYVSLIVVYVYRRKMNYRYIWKSEINWPINVLILDGTYVSLIVVYVYRRKMNYCR